jgi:hypothetical protein
MTESERADTTDWQVEAKERLDLIERYARADAHPNCPNCEGEGIDEDGAEWSICDEAGCALVTLRAREWEADKREEPSDAVKLAVAKAIQRKVGYLEPEQWERTPRRARERYLEAAEAALTAARLAPSRVSEGEPMPPERRAEYQRRIRDAAKTQAEGARRAASLHIGRAGPTNDDEAEAINAAYSVMLDETELPDDFEAARKMVMAAITAAPSRVSPAQVEKVAEAIFVDDESNLSPQRRESWESRDEESKDAYRSNARAALRALGMEAE